MTEASYTAWDDKQYVWPPPDGWYEASDGKWWPQGYGPPQVTESSEQAGQAEQTGAAADRQTDNGWQIDSFEGQTADDERSVDVGAAAVGSGLASGASPDVDLGTTTDAVASGSAVVEEGISGPGGSTVDGASGFQALADDVVADAGVGEDEVESGDEASDETGLGRSGLGVAEVDPDHNDGLEGEPPSLGLGATSVDAEITDTIPAVGSTGDVDDPVEVDDRLETDLDPATAADTPAGSDFPAESEYPSEEDAHEASIRAANEAYGTGLMPPMADRPAPVGEAHPPDGGGSGPADNAAPAARSIDLDSPAFTSADQATVTSGFRGSADQQAMLASPEKGSSRGLWFAILGAVALVAAGAALFFAIGGDGDAEPAEEAVEATGPGSVDEPHPRATGVVVYYPDGGVEQRWIVEVLEPVEDVTSELGPADDGLAFAATRIRITNESGNDEASIGDLRFNLVDGSNAVIVRADNPCPAPADELDFTASVALETSIEGAVCWAIPAGDLADLKLGIESSKVQGRVHILLQ